MLTTVERVLFLKGADVFGAVASEDLVPVAMIAEEVHIPTGDTFIRQGDLDDSLYVIVDGQVSVILPGVGPVAVRGPGSVVGEMALLSSRPRSADCAALSDLTMLRIERDAFWEVLAEKQALALGLINMLARKLDEATARQSHSAR